MRISVSTSVRRATTSVDQALLSVTSSEIQTEVNGGRAAGELADAEKHHMNNTAYPVPGWLGNPHPMDDDSDEERWRVLKWFREDLLTTVQEEPMFAYHLSKLRGKRVACWCRSEREEWPGDGDPCHLDIVNAALLGLYRSE